MTAKRNLSSQLTAWLAPLMDPPLECPEDIFDRPLRRIVDEFGDRWLGMAILGGYLPADDDIWLARAAVQVQRWHELKALVDQDVPSDAVCLAEGRAMELREDVIGLEDQIFFLERFCAAGYRDGFDDEPNTQKHEENAELAETRAYRASARIASLAKDMRQLDPEWELHLGDTEE